MNEQYTFGKGDMPQWVSDRLMLFRNPEGGVGYEIDTGKYLKVIFEGDVLIKQGKYIRVVRSECVDREKEVDRDRK